MLSPSGRGGKQQGGRPGHRAAGAGSIQSPDHHAFNADPAFSGHDVPRGGGPLSAEEYRLKFEMHVDAADAPPPLQNFGDSHFPREVLQVVSWGGCGLMGWARPAQHCNGRPHWPRFSALQGVVSLTGMASHVAEGSLAFEGFCALCRVAASV